MGSVTHDPVVVIGPADLATTAIVEALAAAGIAAQRAIGREGWKVEGAWATAVIDVVDVPDAMWRVACALASGWQVLVLADDGYSPRVAAAIAGGAAGWVSTRAPVGTLIVALRALTSGRPVITEDDRMSWTALHQRNVDAAAERASLLDLLTDREFAVLKALDRGQRAADIAASSVVAIATVRTQIRAVLAKLGVSSQNSAVEIYRAALAWRSDRLPDLDSRDAAGLDVTSQ